MDIQRISLFILFLAGHLLAAAQISKSPFQVKSTDSVVTYISDRYKTESFLHTLLMGKNYRNVWQQPVTLPVLRLSQTAFTIKELGGGMQTKSLKLKDSKGKDWTLRTVDKDVQGAFPAWLKNTFVKNVAQDQVSAAMPYAPLIISSLLKPAGITAPNPVFYYVADDPGLGPYRDIFANTVCMLEERDPGFDDTDNTVKVLGKLQRSNEYKVSQRPLLEARLLDMLVADWDRHYDNWRWGMVDSAGLKVYRAIPRDRDWAFYYSGGLLPKLARIIALRFLVNFKEKPNYIKGLSLKAHGFDGAFLNEMTSTDWKQALQQLQQTLTDDVIEKAVKKLPPQIFNLEGDNFIRKLQSRRDGLEKEVMDYYRFLSRKVQVDGTDDVDFFSFRPAEKGLLLQVYRLPQGDKTTRQKIYERRFTDAETDHIIINGLGNDDRFEVEETVSSRIKLTLNGGTGTDTYSLLGKVRSRVNEHAGENNVINNKNGTNVSFH